MVLNVRSFPFPFVEKPWFKVYEKQVFLQIFHGVVIQKNLRKMYTVKSVFAKVARDRSIIFNYTLNYDFLPAKQYTSVFFLVSQLERGGCSMNITSNTFFFFFEWIKGNSFSFITEAWSFTTAFIVAKTTNLIYLPLANSSVTKVSIHLIRKLFQICLTTSCHFY